MVKLFQLSVIGIFLATISMPARSSIVLTDDFSYANGGVTNVSSLKWSSHSGTGGQAEVAEGRMNLTQAESEDVNALLDGQPYATNAAVSLYARFKINFSALPVGATGGYFAHFKDGTTSGFRARVFASTNGAAEGSFRLGIAAAGGSTSATIATDLKLNTNYTVVIRYGVNDAASTLWLNPAAESDTGALATDATSPLPIAAIAFRQSLSSGNGMGTLTVDNLVVATTFAEALNGPSLGATPSIVSQPADLSLTTGASASFNVMANGTAPLTYQWAFNGGAIVGATASILTLPAATAANVGGYSVVIANLFGSVTSRVATLTLTAPVGTIVTNIAPLRALVDLATFAPTNTTSVFRTEGIVTTHVNITTDANALFYMQDDTAGIAVFVSGGATVRPKAGDRVRVTGPLGHFNGLLEFNLIASNPEHTVVTVSTNNPLPPPKLLSFSLQNDAALIEPLEGSLVIVTNVALDLTQPNFPPASSGGNVNMTNAQGETFVLRADARVLDITGQPKPTIPVNIVGVLGQFDTSSPYTTGYQFIPTRFADIVGGAAAPRIEFTNVLQLIRSGDAPVNTYTEHVLLPGEKITVAARAFDPSGGQVLVSTTTSSLPPGATWSLRGAVGTNISATLAQLSTLDQVFKKIHERPDQICQQKRGFASFQTSKKAVVKTHPLARSSNLCAAWKQHVSALNQKKERRQRASLLERGGKHSAGCRPRSPKDSALFGRTQRLRTGVLD